ncbi:MAG: DUF3990 domain-containing protein [Paludibacteraceae bacterium]|nr:DUF3990 domain-containing protein [Paludibacteraceae bacterium]
MILYHTSYTEIIHPDLQHSRPCLDFGIGFYLTALRIQAERYGERFVRRGQNAIMNIYQFEEEYEGCKCKFFPAYDGEWLDFITACRKGLPHEQFDIIEGGIADDQVFDTIDLYFSGIFTREQALGKLQEKKPNHQICITSQTVLDNYLHFKSSLRL